MSTYAGILAHQHFANEVSFSVVGKVGRPAPNVTNLSEVPEAFRPTEWLSEVIPRKAPYYPQMGDEVMYFRQGHQMYLNAVRAKNVYEVGPRSEPWARQTIRVSQTSTSATFCW